MSRALVLVGGSETWHDCIAAGLAITGQLRQQGIQARISQDAGQLCDQRHGPYDVVVHYGQQKCWSGPEQQALHRFVMDGGGLVPLHCANVMGLPGHELYEDLVGSRFTGHERFGRCTVDPCEEHPVTAGCPSFTLEDELYSFSWQGSPGRVLATGSGGGLVGVPVVYVREHGAGRVCYISLGHDARSWGHRGFNQLLVQATLWAANCGLPARAGA